VSAPTIETDLGQILERIEQTLAESRKEINQKLESIQKDVTVLQVDMATVKTEIAGLKQDIQEIKGSQKAQIWALITILATAVLGTVIRLVITASPAGNP
jgi:peptidoglycan hydrolase CwlO-like protein